MRPQIQTHQSYLNEGSTLATVPKYDMQVPKELTLQESRTLKECEKTIEKGLETFEEVGQALCRIRDGLLYRQTHSTWEAYCQERWQIGARRARQLAASSEVVKNIREISEGDEGQVTGDRKEQNSSYPLPTSERQIRALAGLPKVEQQEVWKESVRTAAGRQVTGKQVEEVINKRKEPELDILSATDDLISRNQIAVSVARTTLQFCRDIAVHLLACPKSVFEKFGQARYFLECVEHELERIVREKGPKKAKIDKQKDKGEEISGFVIYRPPMDHGRVKQRYSTGGGWTTDPRNARIFDDGNEARRKAFAKGDKAMTLAKAVKAFEKE